MNVFVENKDPLSPPSVLLDFPIIAIYANGIIGYFFVAEIYSFLLNILFLWKNQRFE
jgi:hypothetical protein